MTPSPQVPFGAVYFRKSNPPREDWERDYATAAEDGLNIFRHWFMWSAIEVAPGVYDWADYDRQLDLAAEHGIRTIIAELTHTVPEWAYRNGPTRGRSAPTDTVLPLVMGVSAATGGFAGNGTGPLDAERPRGARGGRPVPHRARHAATRAIPGSGATTSGTSATTTPRSISPTGPAPPSAPRSDRVAKARSAISVSWAEGA